MNTTHLTVTLALAATFLLPATIPAQPENDEQIPRRELRARTPNRVLLTFNGDPAHQIAVTWRTEMETTAIAQLTPATFGPRPETDARVVTATVSHTVDLENNRKAYYHSVTLDKLEPLTRYAYRVGDGTIWSEWNHFTTAADKAEPFSFIYMGDAQNDVLSQWSRVIRDAFRHQPDARFVLHAGDLINHANADNEWQEWFDAAGWINRVIPSIAIPGNHEHFLPKGQEKRQVSIFWKPQFEFPKNGLPEHGDTNYYIDYQGVRIIGLNSNVDHDEQADWLDKVLTDNPHPWTIITFHHPVYSAAIRRDNPDLRDAWLPVMEKHKVDLVLQGHDHTYGRSQKITSGTVVTNDTGSVYVVSVSGPKMYDLTQSFDDLMARMAEDTQLYQLISIDGDTLKYESYTAAGDLYDAFQLTKTPTGGSTLTNHIPDTNENRRPPAKP